MHRRAWSRRAHGPEQTADRSAGGSAGAPALLAPILAAIAEAAWIGVFAAVAVAPIGGPGAAGVLLPCVVAAFIGLVVARVLPGGPARAPALLGITIAVVLAAIWLARGWLVAGTAQPVGVYPLLGLAVLRGAAQGDPSAGSGPIETLVRRAPWLLGAGWALGFLAGGGGRDGFMAAAATCTLAFVLAAALALGMSRLAALPEGDREQLGGNGSWLVLVTLIVGCSALVALPLAGVVGGPLGSLAKTAVGIVSTVILAVAGALLAIVVLVVDIIAGVLRDVFHVSIAPPPPPPAGDGGGQAPILPGGSEPANPVVGTLIGIGLLVGLLVVTWLLARRWQGARRAAAAPSGVPEHRSIARAGRSPLAAIPLPARLRARFAPDDALGAYPRLLHDWAATPGLARDPAETPAEHAARLRAAGTGDGALDLLAADYELAAFGHVQLTAAEERRAVRRWRRMRRRRGR